MMNKKILVVDDSATMRMLISLNLKRSLVGISVTEATDGVDAIAKMQAQEFDLILTDMMMPEMDGPQLIGNIRQTLRNDIPIIIISSNGEEKDRDRGLSLGANGYITKPVKGYELIKTITTFLNGAG
jgi:CheY-like chemotaxis protein